MDAPTINDPWSMTVSFTTPSLIDTAEVRRALPVLLSDGWHEIRGLPSARSRHVHKQDIDHAIRAVSFFGDDRGIYFTLNPVREGLGDRAIHVGHVLSRYWFLVDIDRRKAIGTTELMATDEEKSLTLSLAGQVMDWLLLQGWPEPVMVDSGNGAHLLFRIDLENDELVRVLLGRALKGLAARWDNEHAEVDTKVHNASRVSKLPGTWVRKGPNTPERPWRLARLLWVPDKLELVTVEQLSAIAGVPKKVGPPPVQSSWEMICTAAPDRVDSYVKSGIARELTKVILSNPGNRNNMLNEAGFAIGQFVGAHLFSRSDAESQLTAAGRGAGLGDSEIEKTIKGSLDSGIGKPRILPATVMGTKRNGTTAPPVPPKPSIAPGNFIIWGSSIKPRKVDWLWPGRIPIGKQTTFAGQTGMGKTFALCDIAARITTGNEIPFEKGLCFEQGKVLIISAEDDADDTLLPRFIDLGGDPSRLAFLSPEAEDQYSLAALDILNKSLDQMGPDIRMVAIDPPTSYLGKADDHKNAEVRGLLAPLRRWSIQRKIALVFVTHVNKASAQKVDAMARVMGSVAWVAGVRAAHMFVPDPEETGKSLFVPLKVNNAPKGKAIKYVIEGTTGTQAVIKWIEEVDTTADEAMGAVKRKSTGVVATEWLAARFRERNEWESSELKRLGADAGLSGNALFKSPEVNALPIEKKQRITANGDRYWVWRAKVGWPLPESAESVNVSP
jgi:putative DNA primase/helicase